MQENQNNQTQAMTPMPEYQSHKKVWALKITSVEALGEDNVRVYFEEPFSPREFNLLGKPTPQAGWYLVQYRDGYISFSPAEAFEEGYTLAPRTFQDRVRVEKKELDEKITKLTAFVNGPTVDTLPTAEKERLNRQLTYMVGYSEVLGERIAAF